MDRKLYSIITPVYNSVTKIEKTISSVLRQRSELFEYVVMDGGSTDGTFEVIEKYADKIKLVSEKDQGVYDAMNKGIDLTSGRYVYFLGAGDSLRANVLERLEKMMPNAGPALVYGNVFWMDQAFIYGGPFNKTRLKTYNICHQAIFYEKSVFELVGRYELKYSVLADYVFNIKCFADDRICKKHLRYVVANFEGGGLSARRKDMNLISEHQRLLQEYLE